MRTCICIELLRVRMIAILMLIISRTQHDLRTAVTFDGMSSHTLYVHNQTRIYNTEIATSY